MLAKMAKSVLLVNARSLVKPDCSIAAAIASILTPTAHTADNAAMPVKPARSALLANVNSLVKPD
jgi:hypothetical protein